jgi:Tfp pilus assembly protein PilX
MMNLEQHQKGFLSILAIILVVIIGLIGAAATYQAVSDTRQAANTLNSSQAFYLSQSGIEYAKHLIRNGTNSCGSSFTNITLSGFPGAFSVTSNLSGNQCTLAATGYASSVASSTGKRVMQAVLTSMGVAPAPVVASGPIALTGNATVNNLTVTSSSANYSGSTILSSGAVSIGGSAITAVSGLNPSSNASTINPDVTQNISAISSATLWNQFFSLPMATVVAAATQVTQESQLSSAPGGTYYSNGNIMVNGNDTVGTTGNPAILIINGDLNIKGGLTFYGLIYVTGNISISGNANITGTVVSATSIQKTTGNATINFDTTVLNNVHTTNANTVLHFYDTPASLQEVIA